MDYFVYLANKKVLVSDLIIYNNNGHFLVLNSMSLMKYIPFQSFHLALI